MKLNPYLNFDGQCEEAFNFYKKVFKAEFSGHGIMRFGDIPAQEGIPPFTDDVKNRVMHVSINIGNDILMGSDIMPGFADRPFQKGDNSYISIHPDSREEADRIFNELAEGGEIEMPMADQFWGDYYGSLKDRFGNLWMVNYNAETAGTP